MMKRVEIIVNGTAYPCRPTMGAMLRFKQETGREVTEITADSLSDWCTYLWCCVASASRADGIPFSLSLMDFADNISQNDLTRWAAALQADAENGEKKTVKKTRK